MSELDDLWKQVRHIAIQRVERIEAAVRALPAADPTEAVEECHKLVGSLDSYGRAGGSAYALETAELLAAPQPDVPALQASLARLRATIDA